MPKQEPPMATEKDLDEWLKSRGYDFSRDGTPKPPTPTPEPTPGGAGATEAPAESSERGFFTSAVRGAGKSIADPLTGAARLVGRGMEAVGSTLPEPYSKNVSEFVRKDFEDPTFQKLEKFGNEPYQNAGEWVGGIGGTLGAGLLTPEMELGNLARAAVPATKTISQTVPTWVNPLGAGGRWMLSNTTQAVKDPRLLKWAGRGGATAEALGKGAVGGAITDPEDPGKGAVAGMIGGAVPPGMSAALRSRYGQYVGDLLARYVPASILGGLVGYGTGGLHGALLGAGGGAGTHYGAEHIGRQIAHGMAHATRGAVGYHSSPIGNPLGKFGRAAFDKSGKFLGYIDPISGGMLAGEGVRGKNPMNVDPRDVYERAKETISPTDYSGPPYQGEDAGSSEPRPATGEQ